MKNREEIESLYLSFCKIINIVVVPNNNVDQLESCLYPLLGELLEEKRKNTPYNFLVTP